MKTDGTSWSSIIWSLEKKNSMKLNSRCFLIYNKEPNRADKVFEEINEELSAFQDRTKFNNWLHQQHQKV